MREEALSDFSLPWCQAIFADPAWKPILTLTRLDGTSSTFFSKTLRTPEGIRAVQSFEKLSSSPGSGSSSGGGGGGGEDEEDIEEVCMLFSLGQDLEGLAGMCHGAVIMLMLDEVMGLMVAVKTGAFNSATATLNVGFKKGLGTPRVVLCRAWVDKGRRPQGRKWWVKGTVEDGEGGVFATGEALFIGLREML